MKNRISIGISSIVLIFLILCLAVFSLLSLSDAKTALGFSERHADAVRIYYEADAKAQTFLRDYRKHLAAASIPTADESAPGISQAAAQQAAEAAAQALPVGFMISVSDEPVVHCDIPMENGQTLRIEFSASGEEILSCYVYNNQEYVIDTHMPVFGGEPGQQ